MLATNKIRVLVVDDSAIVRKVLSDILSAQPDLEVVGTAPDPYIARDKILAFAPDVLTLDIEMPRMDGLTFLDKLMHHHPLPVIVISSLTQSSTGKAMEALSLGAVDVLAKPGGPYSVGDLREDLPRRVRAAARSRPARHQPAAPAAAPPVKAQPGGITPQHLIAIGASTGGTQAIEQILRSLPGGIPPIVIAQHIPAGFSAAFAERLNRVCSIEVREARGGEILLNGLALIAPGNRHMLVEKSPTGWRTLLDDGPKVCYQRPSVDVLFRSVAEAAGSRAAGALLTGMGSDGAEGLLAMLRAGAYTVAQDENSSVVFGMPREAIRLGAAQVVAPLDRVAALLFSRTRAA
ncbi:MAG: chemotaxis response regulator protein-glutamate methylesterase [Candidatus Solibacter usitatus]|nr:chemotaxis response regulator protein-glutamate methylesterase [Candidatus Solibacter usitatus]